MPKKLENPAARRINCNFSIDGRCLDQLQENAALEGLKTSRYLEHLLKQYFGIVN